MLPPPPIPPILTLGQGPPARAKGSAGMRESRCIENGTMPGIVRDACFRHLLAAVLPPHSKQGIIAIQRSLR